MYIFTKLCDVAIPALLRDNQDELRNHPFLSKETLVVYHKVDKLSLENTFSSACLIPVSPGSSRTVIDFHWKTT